MLGLNGRVGGAVGVPENIDGRSFGIARIFRCGKLRGRHDRSVLS